MDAAVEALEETVSGQACLEKECSPENGEARAGRQDQSRGRKIHSEKDQAEVIPAGPAN